MGCVSSKKGSADISPSRTSGVGNAPMGRNISRQDYYDRHTGSRNKPREVAEPPPLPTAEDATTEEEKAVLHVSDVDFNVAENVKAHNTDKYEITEDREENDKKFLAQLVVRRGQPFDITIKFDRDFDKEKDDIRLIFAIGKNPRESQGTRVVMMLSAEDKLKEWGAKISEQTGSELKIRFFTPPNCIVGKWDFKFDAVMKKEDGTEKVFRYTHSHPIYILFNPWCPDDQVYMDDDVSRNEYVLNDKGRIYRGTTKSIHPKPWNFGQFEDFMLDCCLYLLDMAELSYRCRNNPVFIARKISALANAPDDGGVLVGNWSGDYSGGTSPLAWVGSVAIMEEYWKTKQPVRFGQCWVFSGIVTTICRALGIPARSVTNFASAHDCDGSITIDCHWTPEGEPLEEYNQDSIWNFHVWNDVWMARPDLPSGFGGWQAIDATPQETSDGVYCAGPASIEAIKNGLVHLCYDTPFIFAEVNADRVHWIQKPEGDWNNTKQTHTVGKFLSTKSPVGVDRMDVTHMYKFPEGTQQERTAVWRAIQEGSTKKEAYQEAISDMKFDMVELEDTMIGQKFGVTLKVTNNSNEEREVMATLTATVVYYTGVPVRKIKSETYNLTVPAGVFGESKMEVDVDEYLDKLVDMGHIKISVMVRVPATNQFYCESDDFRLMKPEIEVKASEEVKVGEEYEVEMSFTNPLARALTKCEFQVEAASLQKPLKLKHESVGPNGEAKATVKLTPRRPGDREIVVGFDSKELSDLSGSCSVKVVPASQ